MRVVATGYNRSPRTHGTQTGRCPLPLSLFQPYVQSWFESTFERVTPPQEQAWPHIASGNNTLIFSPTGSGKTLAAFLACLNDLFRMGEQGLLRDKVYWLYLSPLKALNNDIQKNLYEPLEGIREHAEKMGLGMPKVPAMVRSASPEAPPSMNKTDYTW